MNASTPAWDRTAHESTARARTVNVDRVGDAEGRACSHAHDVEPCTDVENTAVIHFMRFGQLEHLRVERGTREVAVIVGFERTLSARGIERNGGKVGPRRDECRQTAAKGVAGQA